MVTKENINTILHEGEEMTLAEWELVSDVVSNTLKNKVHEYEENLTFRDLDLNRTANHLQSILVSDNLNEWRVNAEVLATKMQINVVIIE